jgi:mannose-6-phosphate isomerase-like protein (cupin superfamily)
MADRMDYKTHLDEKFGPLEMVDIPGLVEACEDPWWNQTLCAVNDCVVRLGIVKGEFHWHKHDVEDEMFLVLEGSLLVDIEGETITLERHQGYTVPHGVVHRTRAPERVVMLMVEGKGVVPEGDEPPA